MLNAKHMMFTSTVLMSMLAQAGHLPTCDDQPFLRNGFDMTRYQLCQTQVAHCTQKEMSQQSTCQQHAYTVSPACAQLNKLATTLSAHASDLHIEKVGAYALVDHFYRADGQHDYFIISPSGCMVNTNIDPRTISAAVDKQYNQLKLLTINWEKPYYEAINDKDTFYSTVKVTKDCLACAVVGWKKVTFTFNKKGKLLSVQILNFTPTPSAKTPHE